MAVYNIKIVNSDGSSSSQPIGSTSDLVLMQNQDVTLTTKISDMDKTAAGLRTDVDSKATKATATTSANGLMSAADKTKLNGIADGANKYVLQPAGTAIGGVKATGTEGIKIATDGTISNSGVRSVATGTANGTVSVNTDGATANVAVKGLAASAYKNVLSRTAVNNLQYNTYSSYVPDVSAIAFWDGRYEAGVSNLAYCNRGAFGTIVTQNAGDYLSIGGGTLTGALKGTTAQFTQISADKVYGAVWNDYAEWFEKENENDIFEPGDIVSWNDSGVIKSTNKNARTVVGVYSDNYGHIIGGEKLDNMENNIDKFVPIGLVGRVNVKVTGSVIKGDLITCSNIEGIGIVDNNAKTGTIIGKALENKDSNDIGLVKVMIMLA